MRTSIRVALGAKRAQLARAVLSDSVVLTLAGGVLGAALGYWTSQVIPVLLYQEDAAGLAFAPSVFIVVLIPLAGAAIIVACGLLPLIENPHDRPADVLRRESAGLSRGARTVRSGLAIVQMACCCLLVVSVGFLREGFRSALQTAASHRLGGTILSTVEADPNIGIQYFRNIELSVKSVEGVTGTAWALPITRQPTSTTRAISDRAGSRNRHCGRSLSQ